MKNNYFVSGYWKKNFGDDLFLYMLCKRYPKRRFIISSEIENTSVFQDISNVKNIRKNLFVRVSNKLLLSIFKISLIDIYASMFTTNHIEIGGSIFIENNNWQTRFRQRKFHLSNSKNYFVIGSNFGPYLSREYLDNYRSFFKECKVVFRDEYSKEEIGIETVKVAPDVIFGLNKYIDARDLSCTNKEGKYIVISVINLASHKAHREERVKKLSDSYEEKIFSYGKYLIDLGYQIKLMSFCDFEEDNISIERIYLKFTSNYKKSIKKYSHRSITESLSILKNSDKIIATRFHATILGWIMQKPTLSIAYSSKTKNVSMDLFEEECQVLEIEEFILADNHSLMNNYVLLEEKNIRKLELESEEQFFYLDESYE